YTDDQLRSQTMALRAAGMKVTFRPQVCCTFQGDTSGKSAAWWDAWFAAYQAFLVHHAQIAADTGVDQFFLQDLRFAYPGNPQAAADAEARWRKLMPAVRAVYPGAIGQQLGINGNPGDNALPGNWAYVKPLDDLFDFYAVSILQGVTTSATASQGQIDAGVETLFMQSFDAIHAQSTTPLLVDNVAYASYDGGATVALGVDAVLSSTYGPESASTLTYDGIEQAMVYQSLMRAVASRPFIVGMV